MHLLVFLAGGAALEVQMQHFVLPKRKGCFHCAFPASSTFQAKLVGGLGVWVQGWW